MTFSRASGRFPSETSDGETNPNTTRRLLLAPLEQNPVTSRSVTFETQIRGPDVVGTAEPPLGIPGANRLLGEQVPGGLLRQDEADALRSGYMPARPAVGVVYASATTSGPPRPVTPTCPLRRPAYAKGCQCLSVVIRLPLETSQARPRPDPRPKQP